MAISFNAGTDPGIVSAHNQKFSQAKTKLQDEAYS